MGAGVTVQLLPAEPSPLVAVLFLLLWLPSLATVLLAVWMLVKALRRARLGVRALFSTITADHLRRVGWILIIGTLVSAAGEMLAKALLSSVLLAEGYAWSSILSSA